jgi:hypothetical protein
VRSVAELDVGTAATRTHLRKPYCAIGSGAAHARLTPETDSVLLGARNALSRGRFAVERPGSINSYALQAGPNLNSLACAPFAGLHSPALYTPRLLQGKPGRRRAPWVTLSRLRTLDYAQAVRLAVTSGPGDRGKKGLMVTPSAPFAGRM